MTPPPPAPAARKYAAPTCVVCGRPQRTNDWMEFFTDWRRRRDLVGAHETCVCDMLGRLAREKATGQRELFGAAMPPPPLTPETPTGASHDQV